MGAVCSNSHSRSGSKEYALEPRVLLLGVGGSGKSTLLRHFRWLCNKEKVVEKRRGECVRDVLIRELRVLAIWVEQHASRKEKEETKHARKIILEGEETAFVEAACTLWSKAEIKEAVLQGKVDGLTERTQFRFSKAAEILDIDFTPDINDILYLGIRSTGIDRVGVQVHNGAKIELIDVGGRRSERTKWCRLFMECNLVIYVVPLGDFDQGLEEDPQTNQMVEAIELWKGLVKQRSLKHARFVLIFNKDDVFRQKISKGCDLAQFFPDYFGPSRDVNAALEFIEEKFISCLNQTRVQENNRSTMEIDDDELETVNLDSSVSSETTENSSNIPRKIGKTCSTLFDENSKEFTTEASISSIHTMCAFDSHSVNRVLKEISYILHSI